MRRNEEEEEEEKDKPKIIGEKKPMTKKTLC
jgi:hypothetical protein